MKKLTVISGKELDSLLKSFHRKYPKDLLEIELEFERPLTKYNFLYALAEVLAREIAHKKVMAKTAAAIRKVFRTAEKDISHIQRCVFFFQKGYPHVFFSFRKFSIGVHNSTFEKISKCLLKKGVRLTYDIAYEERQTQAQRRPFS